MHRSANALAGIVPFLDGDNALDESLLLFQQLIDQSNDALFIIDPVTSNLLYSNQKASEHLGYSREELRNLRVIDYAGNIESLEAWQALVIRLQSESFALVETVQTRKDGSTVPVEANIKLIHVGEKAFIVSVVRDLTRRKAAEDALLSERLKQEALIGAMSDGVTMQDTDFRIIYQSEVHRRKQGSHLGELCYQAYRGLDQVCDGCLLVKAFADGQTHCRETTVTTESGPFYMEVICTPLTDAKGKITAGIEVVRDITERKKLEQMKEEMLSSVSHEMRTPVTAIHGFIELLLENELQRAQQTDYLKTMHKESVRLQGLIDNLLILQQLRSGREHICTSSVPIPGLLEEVRKTVESALNQHTLVVECADQALMIEADWDKLKLALVNLVDNALKYSHAGSTVNLRVELEADEVRFSVIDEGPGIRFEEQPHIFERFYRGQSPCHHHTAGTGIGLALVSEIASAHGGKVGVNSQPGRGSTFSLHLPARSNLH